jgi:glycosyltransferase involved in cell wall biosynthesis
MIVRNEAHQLADCLESVHPLFDEIIVVDTGSTDGTCEVARQFTNHVHPFAWCDDFSAARNESLRHATGEWVFWLDADDRLTAPSAEKLARLFARLNGQPAVYLMDTICKARTREESDRRLSHVRLFRRHPAIAWKRRVHERLDPWPVDLGHEVFFSDVQIEHVGYQRRSLVQQKLQRNFRLLQMEYAVRPDDPDTLLDLAVNYSKRGKLKPARQMLCRLFETGDHEKVCTRRAFTTHAEVELQAGRLQSAVDATARGLIFFPADEHLAYLQAEALFQLGEVEAARLVLVGIITQAPAAPQLAFGSPRDIRRRLAPLGLGEVLRVQGALQQAEAVLRAITRDFPDDPAAWQYLARVYINAGDRQKFEEARDRLQEIPEAQYWPPLLDAGWELARGEPQRAERMIEESIEIAPHVAFPRLLRAQCLSRRGAPLPEQLQAYGDVLRLQPANYHALTMVRRLREDVGGLSAPPAVAEVQPAISWGPELGVAVAGS